MPASEVRVETESRVELRFPGAPEFVRLARLAAADAAARAGFDVEETEDLRIAVSELCALCAQLDGAASGEIALVLMADEGAVRVDGEGPGPMREGEAAEMAKALVAALVDEYTIDDDEPGLTRFRVVKQRRSA